MNTQKPVILGEHFEAFVDQQIKNGRFDTTSDVVRAGLRLLEEREVHVQALRQALADGEASGASVPFDVEAFLAAKRSAAT